MFSSSFILCILVWFRLLQGDIINAKINEISDLRGIQNQVSSHEVNHRNLQLQHHSHIRKQSADSNIVVLNSTEPYFHYWRAHPIGVEGLVSGLSVFGAAVMSDLGPEFTLDLNHKGTYLLVKKALNSSISNLTYNSEVYGHVMNNKTFHQLLQVRERVEKVINRVENIQYLETFLPFHLVKWNAIYTISCPLFPGGHPTERGLIWAHYRIWKEFIAFDNEIIHYQQQQRENKNLMTIDRRYLIDEQGKWYKNGLPFNWKDRLIVFEDDVIHAIKELNSTLIEELVDMNDHDFVYLGWCEGRAARPVPLCSHAYAVTREGAKKLVQYFEPCGRAVDEQFVIMMKNNWLKYRRAHGYSYGKNMIRSDFPCFGDKTFGIFRQCKYLYGSLIGH